MKQISRCKSWIVKGDLKRWTDTLHKAYLREIGYLWNDFASNQSFFYETDSWAILLPTMSVNANSGNKGLVGRYPESSLPTGWERIPSRTQSSSIDPNMKYFGWKRPAWEPARRTPGATFTRRRMHPKAYLLINCSVPPQTLRIGGRGLSSGLGAGHATPEKVNHPSSQIMLLIKYFFIWSFHWISSRQPLVFSLLLLLPISFINY